MFDTLLEHFTVDISFEQVNSVCEEQILIKYMYIHMHVKRLIEVNSFIHAPVYSNM